MCAVALREVGRARDRQGSSGGSEECSVVLLP